MIAEKVTYLLAEILGEDEEDITEQTEFTKEYGIEPIDVAKLVIAVEKEFDITIFDDEAAGFKNVADIAACVSQTSGITDSVNPSWTDTDQDNYDV